MNRKIALTIVMLSLGLAGCDTFQNSPTATGTTTGLVLGGVAGNLVGGDTRSTVAGAAAGAAAGLATGAVIEGQQQRQCAVFRGGVQVGTTPC